MAPLRFVSLLVLASSFLGGSIAHGTHEQEHMHSEESDWATRHMQEEHHISNFDPGSFFLLHDFDSDGYWEHHEVHTWLGFDDESTDNITDDKKWASVDEIFHIFDLDDDGYVDQEEFEEATRDGHKIPDFGQGPGHHGDDEQEYELHHFAKYHDENTREEDLIHPEDIAHFKKHREREEEEERQAMLDAMQIVEANIPQKFRKM